MSALAMTLLSIAALFITALMVLAHRVMDRPPPWVAEGLIGPDGSDECGR